MIRVSEYRTRIMEFKNKFDQMSQDIMLTYKLAQYSGKIHGVVPSAKELDSI